MGGGGRRWEEVESGGRRWRVVGGAREWWETVDAGSRNAPMSDIDPHLQASHTPCKARDLSVDHLPSRK